MFESKGDVQLQDRSFKFRIKQDDKFFTRLLSKECSMGNNSSSTMFNGGVNCSIPFTWESRPGTPKHTHSEATLPPLTPPPSYFSKIVKQKPLKNHPRSNLLHLLFPKVVTKKSSIFSLSSPLSSLSSSSSSSSSFSSPRHQLQSSKALSLGSSLDSTMCSRIGRGTNNNKGWL